MIRAFTLIELLIVVAIIAILTAIAVPNFLEAQVRAKASRMKADMRTLATGLETYRLDSNSYPLCNEFSLPGARPAEGETLNAAVNAKARVLERLSTPITYLTQPFMTDVFKPTKRRSSFSVGSPQGSASDLSTGPNRSLEEMVKYAAVNTTRFANHEALPNVEKARAYILHAAGPNRSYANIGPLLRETDRGLVIGQAYDATNGTISYGYIWRMGGESPIRADYATTFFTTLAPVTAR